MTAFIYINLITYDVEQQSISVNVTIMQVNDIKMDNLAYTSNKNWNVCKSIIKQKLNGVNSCVVVLTLH